MSLVFNYFPEKKEFYRNPLSTREFDSERLMESRDVLDLDKGRLTFSNWCFDGYRFGHSVLTKGEKVAYQVKNRMDAVKIYFNRKGATDVRYKQLGQKMSLQAGQYNMLYSQELDTSMSHNDDHSELFSLQFTKACFFQLAGQGNSGMESFLRKIEENEPVLFSKDWLPMNFSIERCIDEIINCRFAGDLRKMFLLSRAIELFVLIADGANKKISHRDNFIKTNTDKEKLFYIRNYILENASCSLTMADLTRRCGLNEYKLKRGFKELFETPVIDFLINCRLEQARDLLHSGQFTISEIAYQTGYSSPQYFSNAYKKKYGIPPGQAKG
ncbi:helix-turn-helix domain-containing protein [Flavitalea flava]